MSEYITIKKESPVIICGDKMMRSLVNNLAQISIPVTSIPVVVEDNYLALHVLDQLKRIQSEVDNLRNSIKEAIKLES